MRGDFLAVVANGSGKHLVDALERAADATGLPLISVHVKGIARAIPAFYRSDHASFWSKGYPAVMLTDTADFRSGHYHRESDTPDTIDVPFAAKVMDSCIAALCDLAGA